MPPYSQPVQDVHLPERLSTLHNLMPATQGLPGSYRGPQDKARNGVDRSRQQHSDVQVRWYLARDEDAFGDELLGGDPHSVPPLDEAAGNAPVPSPHQSLERPHKDDAPRRVHIHLLASPLHALVVPAHTSIPTRQACNEDSAKPRRNLKKPDVSGPADEACT